jgi:glycosyltransferase involved in cell wall biosynthesis
MLGWEFPPLINGGLGVACHGLSQALIRHVNLTIVLPRAEISSETSPLKLVGLTHLDSPDLTTPPPPLLFTPYEDAISPRETLTENSSLYDGDLFERVTTYTHAATEFAKNSNFDLIHAHDWMTALAGLAIRKATGKPLVFHVHSLTYDRAGPEERGWIYEIEKQVIADADLIIPVSHYTRDICLTHYGGSPSKIFPVHNGVTPVTSFRTKPPFPEKLVLFLGRLTSQKAPHSFLQIAARILAENTNVRFVLAGSGDQLPSLIEESISLGIATKVHFPGFLNRGKIQQLLSQTDLYCMPSVSEPFGLSALEAAQFGIPIVLSKQSGASEVLPSARSADAWDLDGMTRQIAELLTDQTAELEASQAMMAEQKKCTWERAAEKVFGLYQMHLLRVPDY